MAGSSLPATLAPVDPQPTALGLRRGVRDDHILGGWVGDDWVGDATDACVGDDSIGDFGPLTTIIVIDDVADIRQ
jgi:hypothetical protein